VSFKGTLVPDGLHRLHRWWLCCWRALQQHSIFRPLTCGACGWSWKRSIPSISCKLKSVSVLPESTDLLSLLHFHFDFDFEGPPLSLLFHYFHLITLRRQGLHKSFEGTKILSDFYSISTFFGVRAKEWTFTASSQSFYSQEFGFMEQLDVSHK